MGMYDYVVVLDEVLRCSHGHQVDGFQSKSFDDPSMDTYLFNGPHVHLVSRAGLDGGMTTRRRAGSWKALKPCTDAGTPSAL